jgi:hypothetical protein
MLSPINMFDVLINVLGPYTVNACVDNELILTSGEEIYPDKPRPWTVETREGELM